MGILRGITEEMIEPIAQIATNCGLEALEVTMNTPNAAELIRTMVKVSNGHFKVGAGTVLSLSQLDSALSAGASFIVSPVVDKVIIRNCTDSDVPVFPGALSPTEVWQAWDSGATMVKLFPANIFGPKYIKELRGPFDTIKILVCGGVSTENISSYVSHGADAFAFGGSIFDLKKLQDEDFGSIQNNLSQLIHAYENLA